MGLEVGKLYEFGDFCLDADERVLNHGGEPVGLPPKVFETLCFLVQRPGHILSKREMMDALWADSFVEESNLTQNVYTLRRVLGTDNNGKSFIENVSRRGYRFTAPVRVLPKIGTHTALESSAASPDPLLVGESAISLWPKPEPKYGRIKSRSTVRRLVLYSGGLIFIAILTYAGFRFLSGQTENSFAPNAVVNLKKLTFTGDITFPVLAPDGNSFAFVRGDGLFVQDVDSGDEIRLNVTGENVFGILQFAPDSKSIYFRNQTGFNLAGSVFQVARFGGTPKLVAENVWSGFGISADGKQLVFVRVNPNEAENALIIKNLETGSERNLTVLKSPNEFLGNGNPAWSPDGKRIGIVLFEKLQTTPASVLAVIDVETGDIDKINQPQLRQFEQVAWLPGGHGLMVSAREAGKFFQLWRLTYPGGEIQKITNDLNIYRGLSLSADGKKMLARHFTIYSHLWTADKNDLANPRQRTFGNLSRDGVFGVKWTPNGDVLYVTRIMGDNDLWLYRPTDDSRQQLTKNAGDVNQYPIISSDGKTIFFNTNRSGSNHIWRMDASGANQTQLTFGEKDLEIYPQISPDGNWLYYIQKSPAASTVWRKSLVDEKMEVLTDAGKLAPDTFLALSPDGKFLAFHNSVEKVSEDGGKQIYQIVVIPNDGSSTPNFFKIAASRLVVHWTSDGTALDYIENSPEGGRIWRQSLDGDQSPTLVLNLPKTFLHNFAWSAKGEKLVLSRGQQLNDAILLTNFQP